jgi:hypothetical protein
MMDCMTEEPEYEEMNHPPEHSWRDEVEQLPAEAQSTAWSIYQQVFGLLSGRPVEEANRALSGMARGAGLDPKHPWIHGAAEAIHNRELYMPVVDEPLT